MSVTAEIKIFPGKEMRAVEMAEVLDACTIANGGIIQGCAITYNQQAQTLSMASGYIMILGRLAAITGGEIDQFPTLSAESNCRLMAVCDLKADTPFYVRLLSEAEFNALAQSASTVSEFNASDGIAYITLGTAKVNPATNKITAWTPSAAGSAPIRDAETIAKLEESIDTRFSEVNDSASASHTLLTQKINAWTTYLQKRATASSRFARIEFVVPSFTIGAGARVGCSFPAIRGTTFAATGTNSRTEARPAWTEFTQTYTTLSDGTNIPLNVDDAAVRYEAIGISTVLATNAAYQNKGKNATSCVIGGWGLFGTNYDRRCTIYVKNVGSAEAVIDLSVTLVFVRRG